MTGECLNDCDEGANGVLSNLVAVIQAFTFTSRTGRGNLSPPRQSPHRDGVSVAGTILTAATEASWPLVDEAQSTEEARRRDPVRAGNVRDRRRPD